VRSSATSPPPLRPLARYSGSKPSQQSEMRFARLASQTQAIHTHGPESQRHKHSCSFNTRSAFRTGEQGTEVARRPGLVLLLVLVMVFPRYSVAATSPARTSTAARRAHSRGAATLASPARTREFLGGRMYASLQACKHCKTYAVAAIAVFQ
jgi:hypothetical protein